MKDGDRRKDLAEAFRSTALAVQLLTSSSSIQESGFCKEHVNVIIGGSNLEIKYASRLCQAHDCAWHSPFVHRPSPVRSTTDTIRALLLDLRGFGLHDRDASTFVTG